MLPGTLVAVYSRASGGPQLQRLHRLDWQRPRVQGDQLPGDGKEMGKTQEQCQDEL